MIGPWRTGLRRGTLNTMFATAEARIAAGVRGCGRRVDVVSKCDEHYSMCVTGTE